MNTPTHILLSVAALSRAKLSRAKSSDDQTDAGEDNSDGQPSVKQRTYVWPAVAGAVVPDAPMFLFYFVERAVLGSSEREIWSTRYFLPAWQDFFDLFNSLPIAGVACWVSYRLGKTGWGIFFASMMLHIVCDLPVHHDDAHRHLWPLTDWRFESPVSYWDPNHFGIYAGVGELALFVVCYFWAMRKHRETSTRIGLTFLAVTHLALTSMLVMYWSSV